MTVFPVGNIFTANPSASRWWRTRREMSGSSSTTKMLGFMGSIVAGVWLENLVCRGDWLISAEFAVETCKQRLQPTAQTSRARSRYRHAAYERETPVINRNQLLSINRFPHLSSQKRLSLGTTVVALYSVTTAGPEYFFPICSESRGVNGGGLLLSSERNWGALW